MVFQAMMHEAACIYMEMGAIYVHALEGSRGFGNKGLTERSKGENRQPVQIG
jgi:hypothetical protein